MLDQPLFLALAAFIGVSALVGGLLVLLRDKSGNRMEDRLNMLTAAGGAGKEPLGKSESVLAQPLDEAPGLFDGLLDRFGKLNTLFEQADTSMTVTKLVVISAGLGVGGSTLGGVLGVNVVLLPLMAIFLGALPLMWLMWRRKRRLKAFGAQLPDAMEMLARALRAGQSIGYGFSSVATEMPAPISKEFGMVFEQQNLGIPLEQSLNEMTDRVPNLDLKFFSTAVILQRQTGGDLAEILDKIGGLIRERFRIWGQVQALTGEGRLSGIILMALPFLLFFVVYYLNPDYCMVLFTDPMGKKMLAVAIVMQILGALVIRKIVNIKV